MVPLGRSVAASAPQAWDTIQKRHDVAKSRITQYAHQMRLAQEINTEAHYRPPAKNHTRHRLPTPPPAVAGPSRDATICLATSFGHCHVGILS